MKVTVGDIWKTVDTLGQRGLIVIPTNIGWKRDGENPMGKGIALSATRTRTQLPADYGAFCKENGAETPANYFEQHRCICFPTKPLDVGQPWMSWKQEGSLDLVRRSTQELSKLLSTLKDKTAVLPAVGCGEGRLQVPDVFSILGMLAPHDNVVLVLTQIDYDLLCKGSPPPKAVEEQEKKEVDSGTFVERLRARRLRANGKPD